MTSPETAKKGQLREPCRIISDEMNEERAKPVSALNADAMDGVWGRILAWHARVIDAIATGGDDIAGNCQKGAARGSRVG